jgi:hypothetical protein
VADSTPDDNGLSQHSVAPSTDDTSAVADDDEDDEDVTARLPEMDLDEVIGRPKPPSPTMLTGGSATALPPRLFAQSGGFRHRSSTSSSTSGSESAMPGSLPRRPPPPPLQGMAAWRPGEHILRAGSRAMPLPSPSFASMSGRSTPAFGSAFQSSFREAGSVPPSR